MKYGLLVIGPAGSGKSTFCHALQQHMEILRQSCRVVNLDPAAEVFLYKPFIDVRELITVEEAATELGLGPNGALVYAMEFLQDHISWLDEQLQECGEDAFFVFDCPGQIELYTHLPLMKNICVSLQQQAGIRLAACCCLDISFMNDAAKLFGGSLMALSSMIQLELPHVNLLTKCDLVNTRSIISPSNIQATDNNFTTTSATTRVKHREKQKLKTHSNKHEHVNPTHRTTTANHHHHNSSNSTADSSSSSSRADSSSSSSRADSSSSSSSADISSSSSSRSRSRGREKYDYESDRGEGEDEEERCSSCRRYSSSSSSRAEREAYGRSDSSSSDTESAGEDEEEDSEGVGDEEEGSKADRRRGRGRAPAPGMSRGIGFGAALPGHVLGGYEPEEKESEGEQTTKERAIDALLSRDPQQLLQQLDACTPPAYRSLNASFAALLEDYNLVSFLPCDITEEDSLSAVALVLEQTLQFGEDLEVRETDTFQPAD